MTSIHVFEFFAGHAPIMTMASVSCSILAGKLAKRKRVMFASMAATAPSLALYLDLASDVTGFRELAIRILASALYMPTLLLTPVLLCAGLVMLHTEAHNTTKSFGLKFFTAVLILQWVLYVLQEFSLREMVAPINSSLS